MSSVRFPLNIKNILLVSTTCMKNATFYYPKCIHVNLITIHSISPASVIVVRLHHLLILSGKVSFHQFIIIIVCRLCQCFSEKKTNEKAKLQQSSKHNRTEQVYKNSYTLIWWFFTNLASQFFAVSVCCTLLYSTRLTTHYSNHQSQAKRTSIGLVSASQPAIQRIMT